MCHFLFLVSIETLKIGQSQTLKGWKNLLLLLLRLQKLSPTPTKVNTSWLAIMMA